MNITVAAAKLHVLQLDPIKTKLGDKWPRLSQLVHALFEKTLKRAQGPVDHFVPLGELAYIATFQSRTTEEATIACTAVAREVCELLFGDDAGDISVRSLIGMIPAQYLQSDVSIETIGDALEQTGQEVLVTKTRSDSTGDAKAPGQRAAAVRYRTRFLPVWDMDKLTSSFLFLSPVGSGAHKYGASFRRLAEKQDDEFITGQEARLLKAASEYAQRAQEAGKVCAIGAGIGWQTLFAAGTRHRYLTSLRALQFAPNCPLLLKIEDVPLGVSLARLAEMVAMLGAAGVRVLIEFAPDIRIPDLSIKLGAVGIGTRLPVDCSFEKAKEIIEMLNRRLLRQSAFSFVGGLASRGLVELATEQHVRFGSGEALDKSKSLMRLEQIPDFPLRSEFKPASPQVRGRLWRGNLEEAL